MVGGGLVAGGLMESGSGRRVRNLSAVGGGGCSLGRGRWPPLVPLKPLNLLPDGPPRPYSAPDPKEEPLLGGAGAPAAKRPNVSSDSSSSGAKFASLSTTTIDVTSVTKLY